MPTYISLIRGINVGGKHLLKMADLRQSVSALGFEDVKTYIQSGNLVFRSDLKSPSKVSKLLAGEIEEAFRLQVPVITRSAKQWRAIVEDNPFLVEGGVDPSKLHVIVLDRKPQLARLDEVKARASEGEELRVQGMEVYLHMPAGLARTKLGGAFLERALGVSGTSRNWRTVLKLQELASEI